MGSCFRYWCPRAFVLGQLRVVTVGGTKGMAQELAQHARSFFSADEAAAAAATSQLRSALSAQTSDRVRSSTMASEAAMQLFKVVDKGKTVPAVARQVWALSFF